MAPPRPNFGNENKGSGFGRISILEALKASEQVRATAVAAK